MYLDDRRPTITPQLAFRVAVLGFIALAAFGLIFFRLWYLQVLSGDDYVRAANNNRVRDIKVQAPRGAIVDREGRTLVDNRVGLAVKLTPDRLPEDPATAGALYERLAKVLDMRPREIRTRVQEQLQALPFSTATVKQDVPLSVVSYLLENQRRFPGVTVEQVFLRSYPHEEIGAHLYGIVGEVTKEQLADERFRGVEQGDRVGQSGIESTYDRFLRGRNGARRVQVDAMGELTGEPLRAREPVPGRQLRLSVDMDVQRAGQRAIGPGRLGAFVAMDVRNGSVLALGSSPSFDPNVFSKQIKQSDYEALVSKENGEPLSNRAIQGMYPAGSTFKLVTAVAALEGGLITPDTPVSDPGFLQVGPQRFRNAGDVANGVISLRKAIEVSSDVFFYKIGLEADGRGDGNLIQKWARRLGVGRPTGIDLPGEGAGRIPSRQWRARFNKQFPELSDGRPWSVGDNINFSVGQGDLATNPLQLAVAYAAVANGGYVVRPQLGERIEDSNGSPLQELPRAARRRLSIEPAHRQAILEGLRAVVAGEKGTAADVFDGFPVPTAGKTGTAEKGLGRADQSWYVALAPYPNPRYVVVATDEAGGFGAETAAPAARKILAALFDIKGDRALPGTSQTR